VHVDTADRVKGRGAMKHTKVSTTPWYLCRKIAAMAYDHIVYIVDDDRSIRESLLGLLDSFGMNALAFGSVAEFVAHPELDLPACLILDLELPDMNSISKAGSRKAVVYGKIVRTSCSSRGTATFLPLCAQSRLEPWTFSSSLSNMKSSCARSIQL
jgi:hypothetical protein